jgi:hypothetical protein
VGVGEVRLGRAARPCPEALPRLPRRRLRCGGSGVWGLKGFVFVGGKHAGAFGQISVLLRKRTGPRSCPENYADQWEAAWLERDRLAHMHRADLRPLTYSAGPQGRKVQPYEAWSVVTPELDLGAEPSLTGWAAARRRALLSGQTGNGLPRVKLRRRGTPSRPRRRERPRAAPRPPDGSFKNR